ncbi:uncharacterized protein LOC124170904 [Ischnura elegans]|uniref:uncharacterized protein LOC124170904 n=1 Tax=Ischnura elegans TaxID=197161 RepID=UPI001ED8BC5F|nr:uncharacterized protein LOC124170904 [Ischnura elegans]
MRAQGQVRRGWRRFSESASRCHEAVWRGGGAAATTMHRAKKSGRRKKERKGRDNMANGEAGGNKGDGSPASAKGKSEEQDKKPFEIKLSDVMGRYLVAKKDFKAAETILDEEAVVVGPCQGSKPLCLVCYRPLTAIANNPPPTVSHCTRCQWPLCSVDSCVKAREQPGAEHDHSLECKVFAAAGRRAIQDPLKEHALYEAIVPLRCLLCRESKPQRWKIISEMESHDSIRKTQPLIWDNNQEKVVDVIRGPWGLGDKFSEEDIHTVCGALEVNAFEIGRNGSSLRALFGPYAYLIAHDCVPNTSHVDEFEPLSKRKKMAGDQSGEIGTFRMKVRCSTPIARGEALFLSYAHTLQGTVARRQHLRLSKFFSCTCRRCQDATELGTYLSALRCPACERAGSQGRVLPREPLDEASEWQCDACQRYSVGAPSVAAIVERITAESESLSSVEAYETFLQRYSNVLHPTHYLAIGAKHSLSQIYGKVSGYTIHEMPRSLLERKRDICRELLTVFDVVEPGKSRLRGITLYELHAPLMTLITRDLEEGRINPKNQKRELLNQLQEVLKCLEEAKDILKYEPAGSSEAAMATAASDGLKELKKWLSTIT